MSIQVWTTDGVNFAAEQTTPSMISFYRYDEKAAAYPQTHLYGVTEQPATPSIQDAVEYAIRNSYYEKDLPWIVMRELERAARDQNPIPERSLADAISYPDRIKIDDSTRDKLVHLLGKGCRISTKAALFYALSSPLNLKSYGIYGRLMVSPRVEYCAGQDYPAEIATIRKLLVQ